jgi:hypothetical protein
MKGQRVTAFGCPLPRRGLTDEGDVLAGETRLVADDSSGAALALQAVAHGDTRWFALNHQLKLLAAAGGASSGHESPAWLWIWVSVRWNQKGSRMSCRLDHSGLMFANFSSQPREALAPQPGIARDCRPTGKFVVNECAELIRSRLDCIVPLLIQRLFNFWRVHYLLCGAGQFFNYRS